jgi:hypothetical protein
MSPSLRRRQKYESLTPKGNEDNFKENTSPLSDFSIETPNLSGCGVLETPKSGKFSLPSPAPRARFSLNTIQQGHFPFGVSSNGSKGKDESKMEIPSMQPSKASPIFRLDARLFPTGTEAELPREKSTGKQDRNDHDPFSNENKDQDEFADLLKERRSSMGASPMQRTSTDLHQLCGNLSTLDDLMRAKSFLIGNHTDNGRIANSASKTDFKGRTPLHLFSCNKVLATAIGIPNEYDVETREFLRLYQQPTYDPESNLERHVMRFLIGDLLAANPGAMMIRDDDGFIPFECGLIEWVNLRHNHGITNQANETSFLPKFSSYTRAVSQVWDSTSTTFLGAVKLAGRSMMPGDLNGETPSKSPRKTHDVERGDSRSALFSPNREEDGQCGKVPVIKAGDHVLKDGSYPSRVRLIPHARFTLLMLSAVVDQLDSYMSPDGFRSRASLMRGELGHDMSKEAFDMAMREIRTFREVYGSVDISSTVVQTGKFRIVCEFGAWGGMFLILISWLIVVASIPDLMKTVLLIEEDEDREFALSTSILRRVMLSKHSVGPWLTEMLQSKDRKLSQRAVDYLKSVSSECSGEKHGGKSNGPSGHENAASNQIIDELSNLQDFVPALLALGDRGMEEASTTFVVKKVLDRMISRPFAVTVVLCDAVFLTLVIVGFRSAVNRLIVGGSLDVVLKWIYVANTGIFYFIIREIGKTVSLFLISKRARVYFLSFWNMIDILATVLALVSTVSMRYHFTFQELGLENTSTLRGLLAITTGFLWLRVLSLLKAINIQLATFVLAILQISKDVIWFCVILLTLVVSFAQMFFTLLAPSSCATDDSSAMQCKESEYLLKVYTILLGDFGDFEREQFSSGLSVFLVVFFSFLVTVVLLNVLIAVASDSYEKCLLRSQNLFGRARVMLIAELVSFQNLLRKTDHHDGGSSLRLYSKWWASGPCNQDWSRGSVLFFCLSVSVIVGWTLAELLGYARGERYGNILFSLASVFVNVALFGAIMAFLANGAASIKKDLSEEEGSSSDNCVQRALLRLLGASRGAPLKKRDEDEWNGRVHYLQREMSRNAEEQAAQAVEQSKSMENLVNASESRLWAQLSVLEEDFRSLKNCLMDEVQGTKETNANVTIAVEELRSLISMAASTSAYRSPVPSEVELNQARFVRYDKDEQKDP